MPEIGVINQINQSSIRIAGVSSGKIHVMSGKQNIIISNVIADTTENWNKKLTYIPPYGTIVIYTDRRVIDGVNYPGIKIADGTTYAVDLPFAGDDTANQICSMLNDHVQNLDIHVTPEEKTFWNNKLNCVVQDGNLILNRL